MCRVYARRYMADYSRLYLEEIEPGGPRGYGPGKRGFLRVFFFFYLMSIINCVCNPQRLIGC